MYYNNRRIFFEQIANPPQETYKDKKPKLKDFNLEKVDTKKLVELYQEFLKESRKPQLFDKMLMSAIIAFPIGALVYDSRIFDKQMLIFAIVLYIIIMLIAYKNKKKYVFEYQTDYNNYQAYKKSKNEHDWWQKRKAFDFWIGLNGRDFEIEVAKLFKKMGFSAYVCKRGGDGGVDIDLYKNEKHYIVQCKAHKRQISPHVARDLYGTMASRNIEKGYLVTLSGGSKETCRFCANNNIIIWDVYDIIENIKL